MKFQSPCSEFIPDHLIEQILLNLPPKSLIRFQSLSKSCRHIITDPSFARTHLQRNRTNSFVVATGYPWRTRKLILDWNPNHPEILVKRDCFIYDYGYFYVVGSCDGILCITARNDRRTTRKNIELVFWNPTTGNHKTLTVVPTTKNSTYGFVFGYDSSIDDYKLIMLTKKLGMSVVSTVEVLAMKSNQWRQVYNIPTSLSFPEGLAASLNDAIYWLSRPLSRGNIKSIIRFDLVTETFSQVSPPVGFRRVELLRELQGKLCCLTSIFSGSLSDREIMVLKDGIWVKLFRLSEIINPGGCFVGGRAFFFADYFSTFYINNTESENIQNLSIQITRWWPEVTCLQSLVSV